MSQLYFRRDFLRLGWLNFQRINFPVTSICIYCIIWRIRIRIFILSWIWIHIKVTRIRNTGLIFTKVFHEALPYLTLVLQVSAGLQSRLHPSPDTVLNVTQRLMPDVVKCCFWTNCFHKNWLSILPWNITRHLRCSKSILNLSYLFT